MALLAEGTSRGCGVGPGGVQSHTSGVRAGTCVIDGIPGVAEGVVVVGVISVLFTTRFVPGVTGFAGVVGEVAVDGCGKVGAETVVTGAGFGACVNTGVEVGWAGVATRAGTVGRNGAGVGAGWRITTGAAGGGPA